MEICNVIFFKVTANTGINPYLHTLSIHDALPIWTWQESQQRITAGTRLCRWRSAMDARAPASPFPRACFDPLRHPLIRGRIVVEGNGFCFDWSDNSYRIPATWISYGRRKGWRRRNAATPEIGRASCRERVCPYV